MTAESDRQLQDLLSLDAVRRWQDEGILISAERRSAAEFAAFAGEEAPTDDGGGYYEHPRIEFPSYAVEWPAEMLHAAAELTLTLAEDLLPSGWSLKDATPSNILFDGPRPVFIDLLSFEQRRADDPIWLPLNQFVTTFLLPLLVNKKLGRSVRSIFHGGRDGIDIVEASRQFGLGSKLTPSVFSLVTLPAMLAKAAERKGDLYAGKRGATHAQAAFVLRQTFRRLRRQLARVAPVPDRYSEWTDYTDQNNETQPEYMEAKKSAVEQTVAGLEKKRVLAVGCNTGYFSFAAARARASVVAIDSDEAVVGTVWRRARQEQLDVLPLVIDLDRPTPAAGWRYSEMPSFLDRARGRFDLVMMLAVIHHLLVTDRIPLREILSLAAEMTTDRALIEFVPPEDPMFVTIARGRDHLHRGLTSDVFESTAAEFFDTVEKRPMPGTLRTLYTLKKK